MRALAWLASGGGEQSAPLCRPALLRLLPLGPLSSQRCVGAPLIKLLRLEPVLANSV